MKTINYRFLLLIFSICFSVSALAQKIVYKIHIKESSNSYTLKFGPNNVIKRENSAKPKDYEILDLNTNNIYMIYTSTNRYGSGGGIGNYVIKNIQVPLEKGDTVIAGYKCQMYQVEADAVMEGPNVTLHDVFTYYTTTDLKYPYDYKPSKYRSLYIPYGNVPGFLLKVRMEETIVSKKRKDDKPTISVLDFTNPSFEPNLEGEVALPFKK